MNTADKTEKHRAPCRPLHGEAVVSDLFPWPHGRLPAAGTDSEPIATCEETYFLQFLLHAPLFFVRHVLERHTVRSQVEAKKFHNAFPTDNIAPEMADDIDDRL